MPMDANFQEIKYYIVFIRIYAVLTKTFPDL
jgi:hypothetical protein